jgi:cobalt-zinc-cadmium efflux system outer membrane protein
MSHRFVIAIACAIAASAAAQPPWTLESSARHLLETAPETRAADAEVDAREAELARDTAWPNPTVEARADRKLGLEDGRGGTDVTQLAITQPLPITRLARQREQAESTLAAAGEGRRYQQLMLEHQAARAFHQLQLAEARHELATRRLAAAQQYAQVGAGRGAGDRLVRYLAPPERTRLEILRESAHQAAVAADGERREAVARFRALLALPGDPAPATAPLALPAAPAPLAELVARLDRHPALAAAGHELAAARAGIAVARASRFADPTVTLFRERDVLGGERRDYNGIVLGVQIPLWNFASGGEARAAADAGRAAAGRDARRRDLAIALGESHSRLARLVSEAGHYADSVLDPSRRFLELTRRGFAAGESSVLALLDANNGYFDAAERHLEMLAEAAAAADLRLAAGESVTQEAKP